MTDYFQTLGLDRRPWLEEETVHERFLKLSAQAHPDKAAASETKEANQRFAEINAASTCLRSPKERVQHLLKLEGIGETAAQNISTDLMELFSRIGALTRKVDAFLNDKAKASSPMLQAQLFAKGLELSDDVEETQKVVAAAKSKAETELKEISAGWPENKQLNRLKSLSHILAVTSKWEAQLRERFALLAGI